MTFMEFVNRIDVMSFTLGILLCILFCMLLDIVVSFIKWMIKKGEQEDDSEEI